MRLLRLSLENWRGVASREVRFTSGVTVIEGPNEIGKSSVVEALRLLFREMHSSNKRNVKAVQPVGQDVGSCVEVEVEAGPWHFVYAKTYNKDRQTRLDILAPEKRQLTGREAHEEVERLLADNVDMDLWDALLVDQGEKVALANLQTSSGLAQALDEAAGSSTTAVEDTDLFSAVQAEYEAYFTLKTAKPRHTKLQADSQAANEALTAARDELDAVEDEVHAHERCTVEVRRLKTQLPVLQDKVVEHEQTWQRVGSLREQVAAKLNELEYAQAIQQSAAQANERRHELIAEIDDHKHRLEAEGNAQAPLRAQAQACRDRFTAAHAEVVALQGKVKQAQRSLELSEGDARHARDLETVAQLNTRLEQLQQVTESLREHLQVTTAMRVDDAAVARFHEADARLSSVLEMRDAAATTVSVTAAQDLVIEFDGATLELARGKSELRAVAAELVLNFPGIADVHIVPSQSVTQLSERVAEAKATLSALAARHGVKDLTEAVTANQRRAQAQGEVERLKGREEDLLGSSSHEELALTVTSLRDEGKRYLLQRGSSSALPADATQARRLENDARLALTAVRDALDAAQLQADERQREQTQMDEGMRRAHDELARLQAALTARSERIESERKTSSDEALQDALSKANLKAESIRAEADALQASLAEKSPAMIEELLTNARQVRTRAAHELQVAEQELAVLNHSLQRSQADGRYEAFEGAQRNAQGLSIELASVQRRAGAAERLWSTLNKHRNAAREAYVRPLKEAIERLGSIVFGTGFEVAIAEDWSIVSRTLHGKTLPFEDLSVGAREQLGILARLAAAQIVARQDGVPLIIDDALGFADPSRLETMGAAIAAAGRQCQIIILTCTPGRFTNVGSAQVVRL